jgi:hypothetical protein
MKINLYEIYEKPMETKILAENKNNKNIDKYLDNSKTKYCYTENNYETYGQNNKKNNGVCVKMEEYDICKSGQIYPNKEFCINQYDII